MAMEKLSIELDESVVGQAASVAKRRGMSLSAWLNEAAVHALNVDEGLAAVREWEAEHGELTEEQLAWADAVLNGTVDESSS